MIEVLPFLIAGQIAQASAAAIVLRWLMPDITRGAPSQRLNLRLWAFWSSGLAPLLMLAPQSLTVTAAGKDLFRFSAPVAPQLSLGDVPAMLLVLAAGVSLVLLLRTAIAVSLGERLRLAARHTDVEVDASFPVAVSDEIPAPIACGLRRPATLVPERMLSSPDLPLLLRHEAAHLRLRHLQGALLQRLMLDICWWNPALHLIGRQIDLERELVCDAEAAASEPVVYSGALLRAARFRQGGAVWALHAAAGRLESRIDRLLCKPLRLSGGAVCAGVLLVGCCLTAFPRPDTGTATRIVVSSSFGSIDY